MVFAVLGEGVCLRGRFGGFVLSSIEGMLMDDESMVFF